MANHSWNPIWANFRGKQEIQPLRPKKARPGHTHLAGPRMVSSDSVRILYDHSWPGAGRSAGPRAANPASDWPARRFPWPGSFPAATGYHTVTDSSGLEAEWHLAGNT